MNIISEEKNIFLFIKSIWKYLSFKRKKQIKFLLLFIFFNSIAEIISIYALVPYITLLTNQNIIVDNKFIKYIFYIFSIKSDESIILFLTIVFLLAISFSGILRILFNFFAMKISALVGSDLSITAFKYTLNQPYANHLSKNSNNIVTTIAKDIDNIIYYIISPTFQLFSAIIISVIILLTLCLINLTVTLSSLCIIFIFYFLFTKFTSAEVISISKKNLNFSQSLIQTVQESIGGIRDIILSDNQSYFLNKYSKKDKIYRQAYSYGNFLSFLPKLILEPFAISIIASFGYFIFRFSDSSKAIPIIGVIVFSGLRLLPFAQRIYEGITLPKLAKSQLVNLLKILENPPEKIRSEKVKRNKIVLKDKIIIKGLNFKYDNEKKIVLNNINLSIKKGEKIGFLGKTGSGKSTLLDLIMALLEPTEGSIFIDNENLFNKNKMVKKYWQNSFIHVPQNIFLADSSIAENIAFGSGIEKIDFKKLKEVSEKAQLNDFINKTTNGFYTKVGERGIRLSGGQRQRIGIARALYNESKIIFLDEATSALDEDTEKKIIQAFANIGSDVTIIIITHRINTLKFCDRIFEISEGKLVSRNLFK